MSFPKGMLGAAVLPSRQLQEEGVSIPPTVSTRSRSWKPARPEAGAWGAQRKKTGELVHNAPTQAVQEAQTQHRHRHEGGQGGDKVGATVVSNWPEVRGRPLGVSKTRPPPTEVAHSGSWKESTRSGHLKS